MTVYVRTLIVIGMTLEHHFRTIVQFYHRQGRMPSYQEIADLARFRSKTAAVKLVNRLLGEGRLRKDQTGRLLATRYFHGIPWLGTVVAGYPNPAEEELLDVLSLEEYLIANKEATYMLRVQGDSMIEAGIMPGDIVLVERRETAKNGEIVIAQVDGAWTLKRFRKQGRTVMLEAANPRYAPVIPKEELRIAAVVCGLVRKY
ncbi:MAG: transcriptional repressor LexA [Nitrospira sp.]|nr:transcriptional repressor LexA [Nitrospira sp.]